MTRRRFYSYIFLGFALVAAFSVFLQRIMVGMPDYRTLEEYTPSLSTKVYDAHDELISEFSIEKRALLTLSQIPVDMQNAVPAKP